MSLASHVVRRLAKELRSVEEDANITHLTCAPAEADNLTHLEGTFPGPQGTPYEKGTFKIDIQIPVEYPFKPPKMRFETRVWHPNVSSQTGAICLDTLGKAWSPVLTIKSALISLQSLLSTPEPNDPQDAEVARMLLNSPKEFERVARAWTVKYAGAPGDGSEDAGESKPSAEQLAMEEEARQEAQYRGYNKEFVDGFAAMGFDVPTVVEALMSCDVPRDTRDITALSEVQMIRVTGQLLGD